MSHPSDPGERIRRAARRVLDGEVREGLRALLEVEAAWAAIERGARRAALLWGIEDEGRVADIALRGVNAFLDRKLASSEKGTNRGFFEHLERSESPIGLLRRAAHNVTIDVLRASERAPDALDRPSPFAASRPDGGGRGAREDDGGGADRSTDEPPDPGYADPFEEDGGGADISPDASTDPGGRTTAILAALERLDGADRALVEIHAAWRPGLSRDVAAHLAEQRRVPASQVQDEFRRRWDRLESARGALRTAAEGRAKHLRNTEERLAACRRVHAPLPAPEELRPADLSVERKERLRNLAVFRRAAPEERAAYLLWLECLVRDRRRLAEEAWAAARDAEAQPDWEQICLIAGRLQPGDPPSVRKTAINTATVRYRRIVARLRGFVREAGYFPEDGGVG